MIDPTGVLSFLLSLSDEWRNPNIIVISPLNDIENEPAHQKIIEEGNDTRWVAERNLRRMTREGWKPVTERDRLGRPSIFMDANKELLLMFRGTEN